MLYRLAIIALSCLACLVTLGCGGNDLGTVEVTGTVTYQEQPVAGAIVTFSADGPLSVGTTNENGVYTLTTAGSPGAMPGEHKVYISALESSGDTSQLKPEDMEGMTGDNAPEVKSLIPTKYNNPTTSGLTATVTDDPAANVIDFPLTD